MPAINAPNLPTPPRFSIIRLLTNAHFGNENNHFVQVFFFFACDVSASLLQDDSTEDVCQV